MIVGTVFIPFVDETAIQSLTQCHVTHEWNTWDSGPDRLQRTSSSWLHDLSPSWAPAFSSWKKNVGSKPHRFIVLVNEILYIYWAQGLGYNKQSKMPAIPFCLSFHLFLSAQSQRGGTGREGLEKSCRFLFFPAQGVLCPYTTVLHD